NTYLISYLNPADQGDFVKLYGVFDSQNRVWTTPRSFEHFILTKTSDQSAIETGNVTKLTP
ncbi:MAG: hypothetical protein INR69_23645, partial [Mucilaginibacter polytrichastri]|nr:hypothetical protein [Mucilaginibacter polytrichastri]